MDAYCNTSKSWVDKRGSCVCQMKCDYYSTHSMPLRKNKTQSQSTFRPDDNGQIRVVGSKLKQKEI